MKSFTIAALVGAAAAVPFSFPLSNGFPNPAPEAIPQIQEEAGGTLPNTALPTDLAPGTLTSLQLVAANELFEVAFFSQLYENITNNVPGYDCLSKKQKDFASKALFRIRAQEELHALGVNAVLKANNAATVGACKYQFPVTSYKSAIALANTFTDLVLGVLPLVQLQSATTGGPQSPGLVPLFGSVVAQEAEQVGWFRTVQKKEPSAAPFLTGATPEFALSAVAQFLVPGSCPAEYAAVTEAIKSFPPLSVTSPPTNSKQSASFSVAGTVTSSNALAYISGQNAPVTVAISNIQTANGVTTFDAEFPANTQGFADGLTIAAVVKSNTKFASNAEVAAATVYGPGLIEYN